MPTKKRKKKLAKKRMHEAWYGLFSGLGQIAYVGLVVFILWVGENYISFASNVFMAQLTILLLFVFSAVVSGFIVLGYPAALALRGEIKRALIIVGWTAGFLALALIIVIGLGIYFF
jgi:hypothetical protein